MVLGVQLVVCVCVWCALCCVLHALRCVCVCACVRGKNQVVSNALQSYLSSFTRPLFIPPLLPPPFLPSSRLRLNKEPPNISFKKKLTGGINFNSSVKLTKLGDDPYKAVYAILKECV